MISETALPYAGYVSLQTTLEDRDIHLGNSWWIGTGVVSLTAGQIASIYFKTPATGTSFYTLATVDKTGDEVEISLIEGCTYAGGSASTPYNLNRIKGDTYQKFTGVKTGGTISGGTANPVKLLGGTAQGNSKPGGSASIGGRIILLPDTGYALKLLSVATVNVSALSVISWSSQST